MKKLLKLLLFAVVLLVIGVAGILFATFTGRRSIVDGQSFKGVQVIADGFSSVAFVQLGPREVALIDAGNDEDGAAIFGELRRRRLDADAVAAILLTHGHPDHVAAVRQFPRAEVMALAEEVPLIEGTAGARGPLPRLFPVNPTGITVTRPLRDGDVVRLRDVSIRVYAVPGHTAGSAAYFVNGVLAVGDSADIATDGTLIGAPWIFSDSQAENRASLVDLERRIAADGLNVVAIVPSHSGSAEGVTALSEFARAQQSQE